MLIGLMEKADQKKLMKSIISCLGVPDYINNITDQTLLIKIAGKAKYDAVRKAATERITDQKALIKIFRDKKRISLRKESIQNITDLNILTDVAMNYRHPYRDAYYYEYYEEKIRKCHPMEKPNYYEKIVREQHEGEEIRVCAIKGILKLSIHLFCNLDDNAMRAIIKNNIYSYNKFFL